MNNECVVVDEEQFLDTLATMDFRFNSARLNGRWNRMVTIESDGSLKIHDYSGFFAMMSLPLEKLHGENILVIGALPGGSVNVYGSHEWVLRQLGLLPTMESGLVLEREVNASELLAEVATDKEDGYSGGVNAAKVIYIMKMLEQVAKDAGKANVYNSGLCVEHAPDRGVRAIFELSEAIAKTTGSEKFSLYSPFARVVAFHCLLEVWKSLDILKQESKIINPALEALHTKATRGLLEGGLDVHEKYGPMVGENLLEVLHMTLRGSPDFHTKYKGPMAVLYTSNGVMPKSEVLEALPPKNGNGNGNGHSKELAEVPEAGSSLVVGSIVAQYKSDGTTPDVWWETLTDKHIRKVVGERTFGDLVARLTPGNFHRKALEFLAEVGTPECFGGIIAAANHVMIEHLRTDPERLPDSIRMNTITFFTALKEAVLNGNLDLDQFAIGTALMYPESVRLSELTPEALIEVECVALGVQLHKLEMVGGRSGLVNACDDPELSELASALCEALENADVEDASEFSPLVFHAIASQIASAHHGLALRGKVGDTVDEPDVHPHDILATNILKFEWLRTLDGDNRFGARIARLQERFKEMESGAPEQLARAMGAAELKMPTKSLVTALRPLSVDNRFGQEQKAAVLRGVQRKMLRH